MKFKREPRLSLFRRTISALIVLCFTITSIIPPGYAQTLPQTILNLPVPGAMVPVSSGFTPAVIKGVTVHPEDPLEFDFIIYQGDSEFDQPALKDEARKLVKYFLASLTVPEEEMWVNLSPYEKERIIPESFGDTEMGRDLLAQDYLLKQLTASLMYPEDELGEKFWRRVRQKAHQQFGTTDIPMDTFNKVWIVPDRAVVYEHKNSAYVIESHLRVMLEEEYRSFDQLAKDEGRETKDASEASHVSRLTSNIIKEILIPEIEKEVNQGETFANLRQIFHSMILAAWYKQNLKQSLLGQVYVNQAKTKGVDTEDKDINQKIYQQYLDAFKKGVYNYIKEDYDPATQSIVPRKYFSGGVNATNLDSAMMTTIMGAPAELTQAEYTQISQSLAKGSDKAMTVEVDLLEHSQTNVGLKDRFAGMRKERPAGIVAPIMTTARDVRNFLTAHKGVDSAEIITALSNLTQPIHEIHNLDGLEVQTLNIRGKYLNGNTRDYARAIVIEGVAAVLLKSEEIPEETFDRAMTAEDIQAQMDAIDRIRRTYLKSKGLKEGPDKTEFRLEDFSIPEKGKAVVIWNGRIELNRFLNERDKDPSERRLEDALLAVALDIYEREHANHENTTLFYKVESGFVTAVGVGGQLNRELLDKIKIRFNPPQWQESRYDVIAFALRQALAEKMDELIDHRDKLPGQSSGKADLAMFSQFSDDDLVLEHLNAIKTMHVVHHADGKTEFYIPIIRRGDAFKIIGEEMDNGVFRMDITVDGQTTFGQLKDAIALLKYKKTTNGKFSVPDMNYFLGSIIESDLLEGRIWKKEDLIEFYKEQFNAERANDSGPIFIPHHGKRLGITPEMAGILKKMGLHTIYVESIDPVTDRLFEGEGVHVLPKLHFYALAGAYDSKFVITVDQPVLNKTTLPLYNGATVFGNLYLHQHPQKAKTLRARVKAAIAFEEISLMHDGVKMYPLLDPSSHVAGFEAAIAYANMTLGGSEAQFKAYIQNYPNIPNPLFSDKVLTGKKVFVFGGGQTGRSAAITAANMGAEVTIAADNPNHVRELNILVNRYEFIGKVSVHRLPKAGMTPQIRKKLFEANAVFGAIFHGYKESRIFIDQDLYKKLAEQGNLKFMVDIAPEQVRNFEVNEPNSAGKRSFKLDGVTHFKVRNVPDELPEQVSRDFDRKKLAYLIALLMGPKIASEAFPEVKNGIVLFDKKITHHRLATALSQKQHSVEEAVGIDLKVQTEQFIKRTQNPYWTNMLNRVEQLRPFIDGIDARIIDELQDPVSVWSQWDNIRFQAGEQYITDSGRLFHEARIFMARVVNNRLLGSGKGGTRFVTGKDLMDNPDFSRAFEQFNELNPSRDQVNRFVEKWIVDEAKALALGMTLKNAGMDLPLGGAKGTVFIGNVIHEDGQWKIVEYEPWDNLKLVNKALIARAFARALAESGKLGLLIDIPAPDVKTDAQILSWMMDEYLRFLVTTEPDKIAQDNPTLYHRLRKTLNLYEVQDNLTQTPMLSAAMGYIKATGKAIPALGVFTGKPVELGGSLGRTEATGEGVADIISGIFDKQLKGKTVSVQGFGNGAQFMTRQLIKNGAIVKKISNTEMVLTQEDGWTLEEINSIIESKKRISDWYRQLPEEQRLGIEVLEKGRVNVGAWEIAQDVLGADVDILVPFALENAIHAGNANMIKAPWVFEGANGAVTPEAEEFLKEQGINVVPDGLANAGGVVVSYWETEQAKLGKWYTKLGIQRKRSARLRAATRATRSKMKANPELTWRKAFDFVAVENLIRAKRPTLLEGSNDQAMLVIDKEGRFTLTGEMVRAFAFEGDRNPLHLDVESAKNSLFRDLVSHGVLTQAAAMRFVIQKYLGYSIRSIEEALFLNPVYFGDQIKVISEKTEQDGVVEVTLRNEKNKDVGRFKFALERRSDIKKLPDVNGPQRRRLATLFKDVETRFPERIYDFTLPESPQQNTIEQEITKENIQSLQLLLNSYDEHFIMQNVALKLLTRALAEIVPGHAIGRFANIEFEAPVQEGDKLQTIVSVVNFKAHPADRHLVQTKAVVKNQNGETVLTADVDMRMIVDVPVPALNKRDAALVKRLLEDADLSFVHAMDALLDAKRKEALDKITANGRLTREIVLGGVIRQRKAEKRKLQTENWKRGLQTAEVAFMEELMDKGYKLTEALTALQGAQKALERKSTFAVGQAPITLDQIRQDHELYWLQLQPLIEKELENYARREQKYAAAYDAFMAAQGPDQAMNSDELENIEELVGLLSRFPQLQPTVRVDREVDEQYYVRLRDLGVAAVTFSENVKGPDRREQIEYAVAAGLVPLSFSPGSYTERAFGIGEVSYNTEVNDYDQLIYAAVDTGQQGKNIVVFLTPKDMERLVQNKDTVLAKGVNLYVALSDAAMASASHQTPATSDHRDEAMLAEQTHPIGQLMHRLIVSEGFNLHRSRNNKDEWVATDVLSRSVRWDKVKGDWSITFDARVTADEQRISWNSDNILTFQTGNARYELDHSHFLTGDPFRGFDVELNGTRNQMRLVLVLDDVMVKALLEGPPKKKKISLRQPPAGQRILSRILADPSERPNEMGLFFISETDYRNATRSKTDSAMLSRDEASKMLKGLEERFGSRVFGILEGIEASQDQLRESRDVAVELLQELSVLLGTDPVHGSASIRLGARQRNPVLKMQLKDLNEQNIDLFGGIVYERVFDPWLKPGRSYIESMSRVNKERALQNAVKKAESHFVPEAISPNVETLLKMTSGILQERSRRQFDNYIAGLNELAQENAVALFGSPVEIPLRYGWNLWKWTMRQALDNLETTQTVHHDMVNLAMLQRNLEMVARERAEIREILQKVFDTHPLDDAIKLADEIITFGLDIEGEEGLMKFDLGGTPYENLTSGDSFDLRLYEAEGRENGLVFINYALINQATILDFAPQLDRSLVKFFTERGLSVAVIHWNEPNQNHGLHDYYRMNQEASKVAVQYAKAKGIPRHYLGYCQGCSNSLLAIRHGVLDVSDYQSFTVLASPIDTAKEVKEDGLWPLAAGMNPAVIDYMKAYAKMNNDRIDPNDMVRFLTMRDAEIFAAVVSRNLESVSDALMYEHEIRRFLEAHIDDLGSLDHYLNAYSQSLVDDESFVENLSINLLVNSLEGRYLNLQQAKEFETNPRSFKNKLTELFKSDSKALERFKRNLRNRLSRDPAKLEEFKNKVRQTFQADMSRFIQGRMLMRWAKDSNSLSIKAWVEFMHKVYLNNELMSDEAAEVIREALKGKTVIGIAGGKDELVVEASTFNGLDHIVGPENYIKHTARGGHAGLVTSGAVLTGVWEEVVKEWLRIKAPETGKDQAMTGDASIMLALPAGLSSDAFSVEEALDQGTKVLLLTAGSVPDGQSYTARDQLRKAIEAGAEEIILMVGQIENPNGLTPMKLAKNQIKETLSGVEGLTDIDLTVVYAPDRSKAREDALDRAPFSILDELRWFLDKEQLFRTRVVFGNGSVSLIPSFGLDNFNGIYFKVKDEMDTFELRRIIAQISEQPDRKERPPVLIINWAKEPETLDATRLAQFLNGKTTAMDIIIAPQAKYTEQAISMLRDARGIASLTAAAGVEKAGTDDFGTADQAPGDDYSSSPDRAMFVEGRNLADELQKLIIAQVNGGNVGFPNVVPVFYNGERMDVTVANGYDFSGGLSPEFLSELKRRSSHDYPIMIDHDQDGIYVNDFGHLIASQLAPADSIPEVRNGQITIRVLGKNDIPEDARQSWDDHKAIIEIVNNRLGHKARVGLHKDLVQPVSVRAKLVEGFWQAHAQDHPWVRFAWTMRKLFYGQWALGGTRVFNYGSDGEAIEDLLRLSQGMSYKSAVMATDLQGRYRGVFSGGKVDIDVSFDPDTRKYPQNMEKKEVVQKDVARVLEQLQVIISGIDVNTSTDNVIQMGQPGFGPHMMVGHPSLLYGGDEASEITGQGVILGMKAAVMAKYGSDSLEGMIVSLQGAGGVGGTVLRILLEKEKVGQVKVADLNEKTLEKLRETYAQEISESRLIILDDPEDIFEEPADIFSPNALGAVLNDATIPRLAYNAGVEFIVGAANNQLLRPEHGVLLHELGILYAPDYVVNSGGLRAVQKDLAGFDIRENIKEVYPVTLEILKRSLAENVPSSEMADRYAEEVIASVADQVVSDRTPQAVAEQRMFASVKGIDEITDEQIRTLIDADLAYWESEIIRRGRLLKDMAPFITKDFRGTFDQILVLQERYKNSFVDSYVSKLLDFDEDIMRAWNTSMTREEKDRLARTLVLNRNQDIVTGPGMIRQAIDQRRMDPRSPVYLFDPVIFAGEKVEVVALDFALKELPLNLNSTAYVLRDGKGIMLDLAVVDDKAMVSESLTEVHRIMNLFLEGSEIEGVTRKATNRKAWIRSANKKLFIIVDYEHGSWRIRYAPQTTGEKPTELKLKHGYGTTFLEYKGPRGNNIISTVNSDPVANIRLHRNTNGAVIGIVIVMARAGLSHYIDMFKRAEGSIGERVIEDLGSLTDGHLGLFFIDQVDFDASIRKLSSSDKAMTAQVRSNFIDERIVRILRSFETRQQKSRYAKTLVGNKFLIDGEAIIKDIKDMRMDPDLPVYLFEPIIVAGEEVSVVRLGYMLEAIELNSGSTAYFLPDGHGIILDAAQLGDKAMVVQEIQSAEQVAVGLDLKVKVQKAVDFSSPVNGPVDVEISEWKSGDVLSRFTVGRPLAEAADASARVIEEELQRYRDRVREHIGTVRSFLQEIDLPYTGSDEAMVVDAVASRQSPVARDARYEIRDTNDATPGGIDFNPNLLDLQIKRDGNGVPLPLDQQPLLEMNIEGFIPVIINITPIPNLPLQLGFADEPVPDTDYGYELDPADRKARFEPDQPDEISYLN